MKANIKLMYREHQLAAHKAETRFEVRVWHRRAGKTFYTISKQLYRAIKAKTKAHRAYYIAPTRVMAKAIAWDYLKGWVGEVPAVEFNEQELRVDLPNGARLQLLGGEHYNSLRGRYADDIAIDEGAHIPTAAWSQVLNPMLADRKGRATFMGTPNGRMNLLYDLWEYAGGDDPEWSRSMLRWDETNVLDLGEIKRMRNTMREEEFAQELECSWDAAIRGAFYSKELAAADSEGRITTVKHEKGLPVICALDLGWSDAMVAIFAQMAGTEIRILDAVAYEQTSIPDMVRSWRKLGFPIDRVILPHDAKVHELGSGKTRLQTFHDLGCKTLMCPNQGIHEGIEATRRMLDHTWFNRETTVTLREACNAYRSEYDEVKRIHRMTPLHDWSSHWADALRYLALGKPGSNFMRSQRQARPKFGGVV